MKHREGEAGDRIFISEMKMLRRSLKAFGDSPALEEILRLIEIVKREVSARRQAEETVRAGEELYRSLVDSTDDSMYLVDRQGRYLFVNSRHLQRMGLAEKDAIGKTYGAFHDAEMTKAFMRQIRAVVASGKSRQFEHRSRRDQGFFLRTISPVRDAKGYIKAVSVISKNISALKVMEERLKALSLTDDLTGLYNRRGFKTLADQHLKIARRLDQPVLMLFADVDDLKKINDSFGHHAGDRVLRQVAVILRNCFRESDIIARIGGDEFVVLIPDALKEDEQRYRERIDRSLLLLNRKRGGRQLLSLSIGVFYCDASPECTIDSLLAQADSAMYRQKTKRRSR